MPSEDAAYRARKGTLRLAFQAARRRVAFGLSGQNGSLSDRIEKSWRRALWIYEEPFIGESLMDCAPRSLLTEQGLAVDLLAPPLISAIFEGDPWFGRVTDNPMDIRPTGYDFAIVTGNRRLAVKRERLPDLPWVSLHTFYRAGNFHRSCYVARRLADLGSWPLPKDAMARHSAQKLIVDETARHWAAEAAPPDAVALAVGGADPDRTYHLWPDLLRRLASAGVRRFLLIGSDNGREAAEQVIAGLPPGCEILNFLATTTVREAQALLDRARVAVCCDGGLMHLALTTDTPVVSLFNRAIDPEWRMPIESGGIALRSAVTSIDGIDPMEIAAAVMVLLGRRHLDPLGLRRAVTKACGTDSGIS